MATDDNGDGRLQQREIDSAWSTSNGIAYPTGTPDDVVAHYIQEVNAQKKAVTEEARIIFGDGNITRSEIDGLLRTAGISNSRFAVQQVPGLPSSQEGLIPNQRAATYEPNPQR